MSQKKFPSRIRYEYEHAPQSKLQYAHGVWGGINPQGELEINFYLESAKMPPYSERRIEPDGSLGPEMAPFDDEIRVISRHIHSQIVLNCHTARAFLDWLEEKVEEMDMDDMEATRFTIGEPDNDYEQ